MSQKSEEEEDQEAAADYCAGLLRVGETVKPGQLLSFDHIDNHTGKRRKIEVTVTEGHLERARQMAIQKDQDDGL